MTAASPVLTPAPLSPRGESALAYAKQLGWAVFPLHTPEGGPTPTGCSCRRSECSEPGKWGKHPRTMAGVKNATTDLEQIRKWWAMWPTANIAVATGTPSNMIVIDVDGPQGETALTPYLKGVVTPYARTGGGRHIVFALPPDVEIHNAVRILPEVDVRSDGGYVVVAPSQHGTGRLYAWDRAAHPLELPPARLPAALLELLRAPTRPTGAPSASLGEAEEWPQGERNDRLFRYVASRVAKGLREHEVTPLAHAENERRCRPPLSDAEVDAVVRSAFEVDGRKHGERPDPIQTTANKANKVNKAPVTSLSSLSSQVRTPTPQWPDQLPRAALYGLAGEYVKLMAPQTEADPAAILVQLIATVGCLMGRSRFLMVGRDRHFAAIFALIVAATGSGKGMSWAECVALISLAAPDFLNRHVMHAVSSGEGIVSRVRDGVPFDSPAAAHLVPHEGEFGARLLIHLSEFSIMLKVRDRQGNTITELVRQLFDGVVLETPTKEPMRASDVHGCMLGHVTPADLAGLKETEIRNGVINRFLVVAAKDQRDLDDGGVVDQGEIVRLATELRAVLPGQTNRLEMRLDDAARGRFRAVYHELKHVGETRLGQAAARGRVHVKRLAMVYATLDGTTTIGLPHMEAALAVWTYCRQSLAYALGADPLSADAAKILNAAQVEPSHRLPRLTISRDVFHGHRDKTEIDSAIAELVAARFVRLDTIEDTGGRNRQDIVLAEHRREQSEESEQSSNGGAVLGCEESEESEETSAGAETARVPSLSSHPSASASTTEPWAVV